MAENQTQLAQELIRIENAKDVMVEKAIALQLKSTDDNGTKVAISATNNAIQEVAEAFDSIEKKSELDLSASGIRVNVPAGYYPEMVFKNVDGADRAETKIEVSKSTGNTIKILAHNRQESGFVIQGNTANDEEEVSVSLSISGKTAKASVGNVEITDSVADGAYSASVSLTAGDGRVNAVGKNLHVTEYATEPSSGYYIEVTGAGNVSATGKAIIETAGYLAQDTTGKTTQPTTKSSNEQKKWYTIPVATVPTTIDPLTQDHVFVTAGYQEGQTVRVSGDLLARLQAI